jgi:hypothetical protein
MSYTGQMKNGFFAPLIFSVILFQLLLPQAQAQNLDNQAAKFRFIKGVVWVENGEDKIKAQAQQVLEVDSMISVEEESFAIVELSDGSSFKVDSNSQIVVHELTAKAEENAGLSQSGETSAATELTLMFGSVFVEVVKSMAPTATQTSDTSKFTVKTKRGLSIGVRGTEFFASVDEDSGDLVTAVNEGVVVVADPSQDDMEEVSPGQSMLVEKGEKLTRPEQFEWGKKLPWGRQGWGNPDYRSENNREGRLKRREFFQNIRQEFAPKRQQLLERRQRNPMGNMRQFFQQRRQNVQNFRQNVRNQRREKFRQAIENRFGPGAGQGPGQIPGKPPAFAPARPGIPGKPKGPPPSIKR